MSFNERHYLSEPEPLDDWQQEHLTQVREQHYWDIAMRYWQQPEHFRRLNFLRYLVEHGIVSEWGGAVELTIIEEEIIHIPNGETK